mgnify:CR=1 FL=1
MAAKLSDRDKQGYLAYAAKTSGWPPTGVIDEVIGWPEAFPAFLNEDLRRAPLFALPDGRLAIARVPTAAEPPRRYDIVDRRGVLVARLVLPLEQQLVGFGSRSAYVAVTNDDGIQRLERHPWP